MTKRQENPLFSGDINFMMNACIGTNGGPYDFSSFGEGFFESAFITTEAARNGAWTVDILVYPIAFNFRHGIELYIKHFIVLLDRILGTGNAYKPNHNLLENWQHASLLFRQLQNPFFKEIDLKSAENLIEAVANYDPNNTVFRYPEDKNKKPYLTDFDHINLDKLETGMKELFNYFEDWASGLTTLCEDKKLSYCSTKI